MIIKANIGLNVEVEIDDVNMDGLGDAVKTALLNAIKKEMLKKDEKSYEY